MKKIIIPVIIILSIVILSGMQLMPRKEEPKSPEKPVVSQEKKAPSPVAVVSEEEKEAIEKNDITVVGRLKLDVRKTRELLILQGKDAIMYRITGDRTTELKSLLNELGKNNLVSVRGIKDSPASAIDCTHSYKFDEQGNKTVQTRCIAYYDLEVSAVVATSVSGEEMPEPKRHAQQEARAKQLALSQMQQPKPLQLVSIRGKIEAIDNRSPIKTFSVLFSDKDGNPIKKTLLIASSTAIAKKSPAGDDMIYVGDDSLKVGQKVAVEYYLSEKATEAIVITILD